MKVKPVEEKLRRYTQNWLRHVTRMNKHRLPKIMMNYRPNGWRRLGRPLKRLFDEIETGLSRPDSLLMMMMMMMTTTTSLSRPFAITARRSLRKRGYPDRVQTLLDLRYFKTRNFKINWRNWNTNISGTRIKFSLAEMKAQWGESRGTILRGDNTGEGAVTLRPVRFQCIGVWISAGLSCIYAHNWPYVYWVLTCAELDLPWTFPNVTAVQVGECI